MGKKRSVQQQSRWWKLPSGCAAGANNRGSVYFLCKWVAGTHTQPPVHAAQHAKHRVVNMHKHSELNRWSNRNALLCTNAPEISAHCISQPSVFFAKLVLPCTNKWKQRSVLPQWHMDPLFRVNHGAAKPSRSVSDGPHLITFPHLDSSIDIFLITSQKWTAFIACSPECFPRWWHQILPGNFLFSLMGAEPIFYLTSYCSPGLGSLF